VGTESLGSLSDRAARHALLYILEARDPVVRQERLDILKATLRIDAPLERSEEHVLTPNLSLEEKRIFVRDGAIIRKTFVPPPLVETALRLVREWYDTSLDISEISQYTQKTFAPELGAHPDLLNIYYRSGLDKLAASLVWPDQLRPVSAAQIQIRIPDRQLNVSQPEKSMHVDGVACPHLDPKELRTFTLIAGVLLTEVNEASEGALRYVPGAHVNMARWFRDEWSLGTTEQVPSNIAARTGIPFVGKSGDVILLHHLVPHAVGANKTEKPRTMLYFRIKHQRHEEHILDALRDPWLEFPALRELTTKSIAGDEP
jgi:hypothetical protein